MTDITQETYTGADGSGSSGDSNRILTLSNTDETKQEQFSVFKDGLYLQLDTNYSVDHKTSGTEITFLDPLWDNQNIVVNYKLSLSTTYITVESVRRTVGIDSDEISSDDVRETILEVEKQVPRYFNTVFTPTERIDILDGNDTLRIFVEKNPLLALRALKIDGTSVTIDRNIHIYKPSGMIQLDNAYGSPEKTSFVDKKRAIVIKYVYGNLDESDTSTTLSSDSSTGTSIALSVADEGDFSVGDWITIYGMDGNEEVAQITATDTGEITVDELNQSHESDSKIVKLEVNKNFTKLMNIVASIALVARIIGQSYDDTVGYTLTEISVQKGEPYTQWRETATQLIRERDRLMDRIKPRPSIVI